jgi:molybdopterin-guanine dinucleotide biosynthesis protein A
MIAGGIVLCGGRSSRMGRPKAWLPVGNEFMLQRVVRVLRGVVQPVVVVSAAGQPIPTLPPDVEIVHDEVEGKGPLAGLAAGLTALRGRTAIAFLSSCDVPFLKPAFVQRVITSLHSEPPVSPQLNQAERPLIAVPQVDSYFHPLAAAYHESVLPHIHELLHSNRLRPVFLFDRVPTRILTAADLVDCDPQFNSLRNLNTPEEYQAALQALADSPTSLLPQLPTITSTEF